MLAHLTGLQARKVALILTELPRTSSVVLCTKQERSYMHTTL